MVDLQSSLSKARRLSHSHSPSLSINLSPYRFPRSPRSILNLCAYRSETRMLYTWREMVGTEWSHGIEERGSERDRNKGDKGGWLKEGRE